MYRQVYRHVCRHMYKHVKVAGNSLDHGGHKICVGQRVEQVLLIDAVSRKGENGRFD